MFIGLNSKCAHQERPPLSWTVRHWALARLFWLQQAEPSACSCVSIDLRLDTRLALMPI